MAERSYKRRSTARTVLVKVVDEAVRAGRLNSHRLADLPLPNGTEPGERKGFVFPTHAQVAALADDLGDVALAVWLMRGCGLRIREALAVHREDFRDAGATLRVSGQASADGRRREPLKHRKPGEFRDVPVPAYLWAEVRDLPPGPVIPGTAGRPYRTYGLVHGRFMKAAAAHGIPPEFTPHSLRHAFASALLAHGVPITDVATWLGHQGIEVTFSIYGHLVPSAAARGRDVLDAEYRDWSAAA
jgi:integrase